ncbi:MAG: 2-oxoglutarate and iron-dependent oxygenase domain-containing protein [Actinomycetota bacterium]
MSLDTVDLSAPDPAHVDDVCRTLGFVRIANHGVSDAVLATARREAHTFFDLPLAERMTAAMPRPGYPYGYNPLEAEALNASIGGAAPPDVKETFNVGPVDPPPRPLDEMTDPNERDVYAPNRWPDALPTLRPALEDLYRAMGQLAERLMRVFALALELPERYFDRFVDTHGSALRLACYPPLDQRVVDGRFRAGAHTDYGTLTILDLDGEPGLEVQSADGAWVGVAHEPGTLIVNLGDLMARWTNDRWRSTMHRVVVPPVPAPRRLTMPFFHNANWDARIECIVRDGEPPRYRPTTAGRHLMDKFRSTVT